MGATAPLPEYVDVLVAGAGPVGALAALDLARRGVSTLLAEQSPEPRKLPKMERCNPRTMEMLRRLGLSETFRAASRFTPIDMDVFVAVDFNRPPLLHLHYPSAVEANRQFAASTDGSTPAEAAQLISQYSVEPILRQSAADAGADVRLGWRIESFQQDDTGVDVHLVSATGEEQTVRTAWLVGCDGGVSTIRKQLGIQLEGEGRIRRLRQVFFRSPGLFDRIPFGKGRHYYLPTGTLVVQDDLEHFVVNFTRWEEGQEATATLREMLPFAADLEIEVLHEGDWSHHLLVAERYRDGRVLIAGDAAHLVIPQGALGMNTGAGDALDLSWKLAAVVNGYGGPYLVDSYEAERREVGLRNRDASRRASTGVTDWRRAVRPEAYEDGPEGDRARAEVAALAAEGQPLGHEMLGVELGYRYTDSPIVFAEDERPMSDDLRTYVPDATPGARLPNVWVSDGVAVQDLLGPDYTLLCTEDDCAGLDAVAAAFGEVGAPLQIVHVHDDRARKVYQAALLLLRPDLHVVWRGDELPADLDQLAAVATGHRDARSLQLAAKA